MTKILLVEDDLDLAGKVSAWLKDENIRAEVANCGKDALSLLASFEYDVVVLDWNLPDITGLEVLRRFRKVGGKTHIIFLTGQDDIDNKLEALSSGADDYMTKPFDPRELSARVKALLRRPSSLIATDLRVGETKLLVETRTLAYNGEELKLRPRECALLEYLMRNRNRCFSSRQLLDAVWPSESSSTEDSVRTCMRMLRHRLKEIGKEELVKTIPGSGYIVECESD